MFLFCVAGLPSVSSLDDYDYSSDDYDTYYSDDNNYQDEKVVHTNPTFLSDPTNQLINEGETIKLPCLVDKLGKAFFCCCYFYFPKVCCAWASFLYRLHGNRNTFSASVFL